MSGSKPKTSSRLDEVIDKCIEKYTLILQYISSSKIGKYVLKISDKTGIAAMTLIKLPYTLGSAIWEKKGNFFQKLINGIKEVFFELGGSFSKSFLEAVAEKLMTTITQKIKSQATNKLSSIFVGLTCQILNSSVFKAALSGGIGFFVDMVINFVRIYSNDDFKDKEIDFTKSLLKAGGSLLGSIIGSAYPVIGSFFGGWIGWAIGWGIGWGIDWALGK